MADEQSTQDNPWQRSDRQLIIVVNPKQRLHECGLWQAADQTTSPVWSEDVAQRLPEGLL